MKQVQVIIRDGNKTVAKEAYTSVASYIYYAYKFISDNLMPGMEVEIRVGRQYSTFKLHSEFCDLVYIDYEFEDLDSAIYNWCNYYDTVYYIKNYLPQY